MQALASTLDNSDIADLKDQFNAIDIDRNGTITLEEMREALQKDRPWTIKESRIVEILQAVSHSYKTLSSIFSSNDRKAKLEDGH